MNKTQLIQSLSEETTFSKKDIAKVLDALTRTLVRVLKKGEKMQWSGFGTFSSVRRASRMGRNPATGQSMKIPESIAAKFKSGKGFKQKISSRG